MMTQAQDQIRLLPVYPCTRTLKSAGLEEREKCVGANVRSPLSGEGRSDFIHYGLLWFIMGLIFFLIHSVDIGDCSAS